MPSWIDYAAAGATNDQDLADRITWVLRIVSLEEDFYAFGLRTKLADDTEGESEEMFLNARRIFLERLTKDDNAADVEPFDVTRFNSQMTIFQNLVFGAVSSTELLPNESPSNSPLWKTLEAGGLDSKLYALGREASAVIVDLFGEVSDNMKILERLDLIDPTKLTDYSAALGRTDGVDFAAVANADRQKFIRVALSYSEPRHRLDLLDRRAAPGSGRLAHNIPRESAAGAGFGVLLSRCRPDQSIRLSAGQHPVRPHRRWPCRGRRPDQRAAA